MVTMSGVWDRTTAFLGTATAAILPIALLMILVPLALQGDLGGPMAIAGPGARLMLALGSLVLSLVSLCGQLAIVALAIAPQRAADAAALALTRMLPVVGVMLVVGIVLAVVFGLPLVAILYAAGVTPAVLASGSVAQWPAAAALALGLYMLVGLVIGLWLAARLSLVMPVLIAERRGLGSIARSFALTKGLTLRIVGVMVLYGIVALVALMAVRLVFGSLLGVVAGGTGAVTVGGVLTAAATAAVSTVFTVLVSAFAGKLYLAAREARERPLGTS